MTLAQAKLARILAELREECQSLDQLHNEFLTLRPEERAYLRALASILHDFYSGVERFFRKIAQELNGGLPAGADWHRELLHDMSLDIPGLRPPVIRKDTEEFLTELMKFRHLFRNQYGFLLRADRLDRLRDLFNQSLPETRKDLEVFINWLQTQAIQ